MVVLSNGEMHVGINHFAEVHDFYYPYVGLENHSAAGGLRHRIGLWIDGAFTWLDDGSWQFDARYHDHALIGNIQAVNQGHQIKLEFDDCVDGSQTAFVRNIHVINMADHERDIRLYLHQVFVISDSLMSDTVQYLPTEQAVMHYKGRRVFIVNGCHADGSPIDDYSVGAYDSQGHEGTFRDAEDGILAKNTVEHGRVDSVIGFYQKIASNDSARIHYWIAAGKSFAEAHKINEHMVRSGVHAVIDTTVRHWREWLKPVEAIEKKIPAVYRDAFIDSLLVVKSHIDDRGAVIASLDTTMLNHNCDSYAYCWPRDSFYVLWPLLRLGYKKELLRFFGFIRRVLHEDGYLHHKYQADGAIGSSWHPYVHKNGTLAPPIQTDETAAVLFLIGQYYRQNGDKAFLEEYFAHLVEPMANFLAGYTDKDGLPLPSYELWEEKFLTTTYTTAITYASLLEASEMADEFGRAEDGARWRAAADAMKSASKIFINSKNHYFYKGYLADADGNKEFDETIDSSSLYGVFMFGLFDLEDDLVKAAYKVAVKHLSNETTPNGKIRYEKDAYYRHGEDDHESNVWPVVTLWFAQYALEVEDTVEANKTIDWILSLMRKEDILSEQYSPHHYVPTSVAPLIWSHAELVSTLLDFVSDPVIKGDEDEK